MTFYEAALRVLEDAGKPLTNIEITQRSIEKNLLSHVGKTPEMTMLARLAAMAKRPRDRKVIVTAKDTFALADWMLAEDAAALQATGVIEPNPEEAMPPYRPTERHPESRVEFARGAGRGERDRERGHKRRDRDEERKKKYPPISEVVFEVLSEAEGRTLSPDDLLAKARERELISDELSLAQVLNALADDNQKRIDAGRRPQFHYKKPVEGPASLWVDAGGETPPLELQQAFCAAANIPFENGRAVVRRPSFERPSQGAASPAELSPEDQSLSATAKHAVRDARKAVARVLRTKLAEFDVFTFEKSVVRMLHGHGFRELKVAKRSKEGQVLTARKRDGSLELRIAVRVIKGQRSVERRDVQELRRDLGHYGANMGLICSPGEPRGDAKSEALQGALVMLWCGEGLAEKFFEAHVGVSVQSLELYEIDEAFFAKAQQDAEDARVRREERHRDKQTRPDRPVVAEGPRDEAAPATEPFGIAAPSAPSPAAEAPEGDDEGDDEAGEGAEGTPGEVGAVAVPGAPGVGGRRRRRRRRGRRGRPVPGAPGAPASSPEGAVATAPAPEENQSATPPPAPQPTAPTAPSDPGPSGT
jgi:ribonuclease E